MNHIHKARFRTFSPFFYKAISSPIHTFCLSIAVALLAFPLSPHLSMAILALYYVLLAYFIERKHLDFLLIPPLCMFAIIEFSRIGLGPLIYSLANDFETDQYILQMQVAHVTCFPLIMFVYYLITRRLPAFSLPAQPLKVTSDLYAYLKCFGLVCFVFAVFGLAAGAATGGMDRGDFGATYSGAGFGIYSIFDMFVRLFDMAFFLLPLVLMTVGKSARQLLKLALVGIFIFFFATGTRGFIFYCAVFMICGYWMFTRQVNWIKTASIVLVLGMLFLIPTMAIYRGTDAFSSSKLLDLPSRLAAIASFDENADSLDLNYNLTILSQSLIGVSDRFIYLMTPKLIPHAGWENIDALLYVWVPKMLYRDKPLLYESDDMLYAYTRLTFERSFATITFNADMYRRFGWTGVFAGNIVLGLVYGFAVRFAFGIAKKKRLFGALLVVFIAILFRNLPVGTMLRTFWYWLYEIPKYIIILLLIHHIVIIYLKTTRKSAPVSP